MQHNRHVLFGTLVFGALAICTSPAHAFEFRCRFVERTGNLDHVLPADTINATDLLPHRIRIQFGVFDTDSSPAPAGGFVGWNVGAIAVSGPPDNSDETRTNGRLSPFNASTDPGANGNPPLPDGDPFTSLTDIDATLGTQSPPWLCGPDGQPLPMPQAAVRGRNSFVSVYEVTIDPRDDAVSYTLTFSGNLLAATSWEIVEGPTPPRCDGNCPPPAPIECQGILVYEAMRTAPESFACTLHVVVPTPAAAPLLLTLALTRPRRRP